jgi:peptide/nickel transport system permease protein
MSAVAVPALSPRARRRRLLWARFLRRKVAVVCLLVIVIFVVAGAFAPWIAPYSPRAVDFDHTTAPPSWQHLFGTDELGRDTFSRLVWGARASMQVGLLATALGMLVAVPLGLIAGYYGGWLDAVVARTTDIMLAFPFVVLAILLAAIIGTGLKTATIALGIAAVPRMLRVTRGETLALREAEFVPAAVASGAGDGAILFRHILPNMAGPLIVAATLTIPNAIIGEAALSFLGLGITVPDPSWGNMLLSAQSFYYQAPRLAIFPGVAILLAALAFNLLGDALRDILDPKTVR